MSVPKITHKWLVDKGACYYNDDGTPCRYLGEWLLPRLPIDFEQLGRMRKIPSEDKLWALYGLMSPEQSRLSARRSALRCIGNWCNVPPVVMRWLEHGREEDRSAASAAAWSATSAAARSAASAAARSATSAAARSDASAAARSATAAARSAASAAAWSATSAAASAAARSAAWNAAWNAAESAAESAAVRDAIAILRGEAGL